MANKVEIQITGNNKGAKLVIEDTAKQLTRLEGVGDSLGYRFGSSLRKMGIAARDNFKYIALGAASAATALGYMVKKAIDTADNMSKTAQKIGIATEELSTLSYVAELSDVSFTTLESGLIRFSRNMYDATQGIGEARLAFRTLGIEFRNTDSTLKSADQSLKEIADKFAAMPDGVQKTAIATQLFGRSGAQLIPLLNAGADGIADMQEEARKLGLEISTSTGKRAEEFNDNLTRLKKTITGVGLTLADELLPTLTGLSNALVTLAKNQNAVQVTGEGLSFVLKSLITFFGAVYAGVYVAGQAIGGFGATVAKMLMLDFEGAAFVASKNWKDIADFSLTMGDAFNALWNDAQNSMPALNTGFDELTDNINDTTNKVRTLQEELKYLDVFLKNNIQPAGAMVDPLTNPILNGAFYQSQLQPGEDALRASVDRQIALITQVTEFDVAMAILREESVTNMFGNMANAALGFYDASGQASKEWFAVYKAFAIAQTAIATYQAATEAYKSMVGIPFVGPALAVAAAAAATAFGLGNIARISSMSPGGGAGISSPSAGSAPRIPQNTITNNNGGAQYINITINGNYWDDDKIARELLPGIKKAYGDQLGGG